METIRGSDSFIWQVSRISWIYSVTYTFISAVNVNLRRR